MGQNCENVFYSRVKSYW